jgi:hypothetical protein
MFPETRCWIRGEFLDAWDEVVGEVGEEAAVRLLGRPIANARWDGDVAIQVFERCRMERLGAGRARVVPEGAGAVLVRSMLRGLGCMAVREGEPAT